MGSKKRKFGNKPMASGTVPDATYQQDPSMIENEASTGDETLDETPSVDNESGPEGPVNEATPSAEVDAPETTEPAPAVAAEAPSELPSYQQTSVEESILASHRHRLDEYCKLMGRSVPVTAVKGSLHQLNLYRLFLDVLRLDGNLFTKAWSDLLAGVDEHRNGCFDPLYAHRFMNEIKALSKTELRVFMNLMHLVRITADRKSRAQMLKTVDFTSVTSNIPVAGAFEKLHGFYFSA